MSKKKKVEPLPRAEYRARLEVAEKTFFAKFERGATEWEEYFAVVLECAERMRGNWGDEDEDLSARLLGWLERAAGAPGDVPDTFRIEATVTVEIEGLGEKAAVRKAQEDVLRVLADARLRAVSMSAKLAD